MNYRNRVLWVSTPLVAVGVIGLPAAQANAKSHGEVIAAAKAATVKICPTQGSGVIIAKAGNVYTVLTNRHVLEASIVHGVSAKQNRKNANPCTKSAKHSIFAPDGQKYLAEAKTAKNLPGEVDLAVIQFRSNRSYPVAPLGNPAQGIPGSKVHTAGYLASTGQFKDGQGLILANSSRSTRLTNAKGYSMVYDAFTINGMSGSGVWNDRGEVIAIHGFGWRYEKGTITSNRKIGQKLGWNMGIPITRFLQNAPKVGVTVPTSFTFPPENNQSPSADDYFIAAADKYIRPGTEVAQNRQEAIQYLNAALVDRPDYAYAFFLRGYLHGRNQNHQAALSDYNRAITLNPNLVEAYRNRGILKSMQLQDHSGAVADFSKAIAIDPQFADAYIGRALVKQQHLQDYTGAMQDYNKAIALNDTIPEAFIGRGILKQQNLQDYKGALQDYDRAIALNPNYLEAYLMRGFFKQVAFQDTTGALADYNRMIEIDGQYAEGYHGRGLLKALYVKDYPGALADYNKAIAINSRYVEAYINRGILKAGQLKDYQGALADYNRAIAVNPKSASAYQNRGLLKTQHLKDNQGAMADFDRAIAIDPNGPEAYAYRGWTKQYSLNDRAGAIADLQIAARLCKAQGRQAQYALIAKSLRELGVTTP
jgi:tetratricopeptide (TPR) repeat protein/V8-like Glu-specific endopeptidase